MTFDTQVIRDLIESVGRLVAGSTVRRMPIFSNTAVHGHRRIGGMDEDARC